MLSGGVDDILGTASQSVADLQATLNAYAHAKHTNLFQPFRFDGHVNVATVVATFNAAVELIGDADESALVGLLSDAAGGDWLKKMVGFFAYLADHVNTATFGYFSHLWPDQAEKYAKYLKNGFDIVRALSNYEVAVSVKGGTKEVAIDLSWINSLPDINELLAKSANWIAKHAKVFASAIAGLADVSLRPCIVEGRVCAWATNKDAWDRKCQKDWTPDGERCWPPGTAATGTTTTTETVATGTGPKQMTLATDIIMGKIQSGAIVPPGTVARYHRGEKKFYIFFPKTMLQGLGGLEDGTSPDLKLDNLPTGATRGKDIVPIMYSWLFWSAVTVGAAGAGYGIYRWKKGR